ncbi:MAG: type III pantothenate kinase [Syntrophomonadaceae bacterium]|nr:type III pantothenate kinase [Syntrophomonadaceae bacterium]
MILVFDIGNTNIVVGIYRGEQLLTNWRMRTDNMRTADEYGVLLQGWFMREGLDIREVKAVVISSVVPSLMNELEWMSQRYFKCKPLVVGPGIRTGVDIKYENPREVGADRVVNALAAHAKYPGNLIIIDFGTATTFCVVTAAGEYMGGAIAPGIRVSTEALVSRAAKLPRVELSRPRTVVGRNTVNSMQAGIIFGFAGQVEGIVGRIKAELEQQMTVIATGGLAAVIAEETECIDIVDENLTLEGLRMIYEINNHG